MSRSLRVLLTPGDMGPDEWSDVAQVLTSRGHQVLLDTDLSYDRGILSAAGTQLQRLHDPTFWALHGTQHLDIAVGIGMALTSATT